MTIYEVSECYNIPIEIVKEYEQWGLCCGDESISTMRHYDDKDIEQFGQVFFAQFLKIFL